MGNEELYSFIAFVSVLVYLLLHHAFRNINKENSEESIAFGQLLKILIVFSTIDAIWGLFDAKVLIFGKPGIYVASYLFHFCASLSAFFWLIFTRRFEERKFEKKLLILEAIPACVCLVVMVSQFAHESVFSIDGNAVYHTGPYRMVLFVIQMLYFFYVLVRSLYLVITDMTIENRRKYYVAIEYSIVLVICGFMQYFFPNAPYYSVGYMFATIIVFNGCIVIDSEDKSRQISEYHKKESEEIHAALEALGRNYISIHLFDLEINRQQKVKSTPEIDYFVKEEDDAATQISKVIEGVTESEYTDEMLDFVDITTLSKRMKSKNSISCEFKGKNYGWCVSSFIKVEEDEDGNLLKVVHAVQSVDETKRREKELQDALARAYQNKNAIYAEMLKMQNSGMIATDLSENVIYANDMALKLFEYPEDTWEGITYRMLLQDAMYLDVEKAANDYKKLLRRGTPISYCMKIETRMNSTRYIKADARKLTLQDNSQVIITSLVDITESKILEDKLRILSETDALTGIDNRRSGEAKTMMLLSEHTAGMLCLIDINRFKTINDTYGHHTGDEALIAVSRAIRESFRASDVVMRIGGDEFAVFAKDIISNYQADTRIRNLFKRIDDISLKSLEGAKLSISLGAQFVSSDSTKTFEEICKEADELMYECKGKEGSNYKTSEIAENA